MRVPDGAIDHLREHGYLVVEGFLGADELKAAQDALWLHYPRPDEFFAEPSAHPEYAKTQFAGIRRAPWRSWELNRLLFHPDLLDLAERFLGGADLRLYKGELWAKYSGTIDYDQSHHRDYGNHGLVVPSRSDPARQMTSFMLLSDVTEEDGPTKVVPYAAGRDVPYWPVSQPEGAFADVEVAITGPAGTLFSYRSDILHRGSRMTGEHRTRFALLADYELWGPRWTGKTAWPDNALTSEWRELMERTTPRERAVFGFPSPGDPYWDEQTVADVATRYPGMDMSPYRA
jgi:hypothetical protein